MVLLETVENPVDLHSSQVVCGVPGVVECSNTSCTQNIFSVWMHSCVG